MRPVQWALRSCSLALLSWMPMRVRAAGEVDCHEGPGFRDAAEPRAVVDFRAKVRRPAELFLRGPDRHSAAGAERAGSSTVRLDSPDGNRDLRADRLLAAPHMADPMLAAPHTQVGVPEEGYPLRPPAA